MFDISREYDFLPLRESIKIPYGRTPRHEQLVILDKVDEAVRAGKKYIVIQGPTGVGKTAVAEAVLSGLGGGYVCTSTKQLQQQYCTDYKGIKKVRGRTNFKCLSSVRDDARIQKKLPVLTCDKGRCTSKSDDEDDESESYSCPRKPITESKLKEFGIHSTEDLELAYTRPPPSFDSDPVCFYWIREKKDRCIYWRQKVSALESFKVSTNYTYLIRESNGSGTFSTRRVLISDEGHNTENQILDYMKFSITNESVQIVNTYVKKPVSFPKYNNYESVLHNITYFMEWAGNQLLKASEEAEYKINSELVDTHAYKWEGIKLPNGELKTRAVRVAEHEISADVKPHIKILINDLKTVTSLLRKLAVKVPMVEANINVWTMQHEYSSASPIKVAFKPVIADKYAENLYFRLGEIVVILSATILDYDNLIKSLGIPPELSTYIKIDPIFDAKNHRIYELNVSDFKYVVFSDKSGHDPMSDESFCCEVVERIDLIIDLYPRKRGIIHTRTYSIANAIKALSRHSDRLTAHRTEDREGKVKLHKDTEGSILLSPSMTEGVDLPGDHSVFQIIVKYPYPPTKDPVIKKRTVIDPDYPIRNIALTVTQSLGRSVRKHDDIVDTFILDERFRAFHNVKEDLNEFYMRHLASRTELYKMIKKKGKSDSFFRALTSGIKRPTQKSWKRYKPPVAYVEEEVSIKQEEEEDFDDMF